MTTRYLCGCSDRHFQRIVQDDPRWLSGSGNCSHEVEDETFEHVSKQLLGISGPLSVPQVHLTPANSHGHGHALGGGNESLSSSTSSIGKADIVGSNEEKIRRKLKWYFMNPYQKFKVRGRKPWKLVLQVAKIILVTVQAIWFAIDHFAVVGFNTDNISAFKNIFIKGYQNREFYPLYTKHHVYDQMYHVWKEYYNFSSTSVGSYRIPHRNGMFDPIHFCVNASELKNYIRREDTDDLPGRLDGGCYPLKQPNRVVQSLQEFVAENQLPTKFEWISVMKMIFRLNATNHKELDPLSKPDCYQFTVSAVFDNADLDGLMQLYLDSKFIFHPCDTDKSDDDDESLKITALVVDIIVTLLCIASFGLCARSLSRHIKLCRETGAFFKEYRHEKLTMSDKLNFINFWLVLIVISDILVLCGSVIKVIIDQTNAVLYDACSLLLGVAVVLCWTGVLRYLGYLKGYNALLVTLHVAFPTVMRFIVCASLIYFGFAFCGWAVFGPYHYKFKDLITTSECLFSLINGDDMYNTFKSMDDSDKAVWIFSKIYLYIFISLFIFVVLSLFIGIISDTYERIKDYGHPPKTRIELFMEGKEYTRSSTNYSKDAYHCHHFTDTIDHEDHDHLESSNEAANSDGNGFCKFHHPDSL